MTANACVSTFDLLVQVYIIEASVGGRIALEDKPNLVTPMLDRKPKAQYNMHAW